MEKWKYVLVLVINILIVGNIYFWHFQYTFTYQSRYQLGYSQGYTDGNTTGYDLGYNVGYDLGFENGDAVGYVQGLKDGVGRGYTLRDPSYDEMIMFTTLDKTDENQYAEKYTCVNFAADFKNNAFQSGYKCGLVYIYFDENAHSIICFNTTDHGLIFIESQSDDLVNLTIGHPYWDRTKYEEPDYDDTVIRFIIIW